MKFQREIFCPELFGEILPLAERNWQEMNPNSPHALSLDFLRYHDMEVVGRLRVYTARRDSVLVGYTVFFIGIGTHTAEQAAYHDALYLSPAVRGVAGVRFIEWATKQLLAEPAIRRIVQSSRLDHPIDRMLTRLGYVPIETLYVLDVLQKELA